MHEADSNVSLMRSAACLVGAALPGRGSNPLLCYLQSGPAHQAIGEAAQDRLTPQASAVLARIWQDTDTLSPGSLAGAAPATSACATLGRAPVVDPFPTGQKAPQKACARFWRGIPGACPVCEETRLQGRQTVCSPGCRRERSRRRSQPRTGHAPVHATSWPERRSRLPMRLALWALMAVVCLATMATYRGRVPRSCREV
jgi:hypothetical protein